ETFDFHPGQYLNIIKGNIRRCYSISNTPNPDNLLEFYIKNFQGGVLSKYWFEDAKINDLLRIEGPKGTFFLRNNITENLIFLSTGTGIAPVRSILKSLQNSNTFTSRVFLFWGGRYLDDLFLDPMEVFDGLNYFPVLSREDVTPFE